MNAPKLAIGDGAMGFWAAMDEIYPTTRHQRCWQHKTMNVLNCLPKLSQPKAKAAIHDIHCPAGHCAAMSREGGMQRPKMMRQRRSTYSSIAPCGRRQDIHNWSFHMT
jgi:transposase-like protein